MKFINLYELFKWLADAMYFTFFFSPLILVALVLIQKMTHNKAIKAIFVIVIVYDLLYLFLIPHINPFYNRINYDDIDYFYNNIVINKGEGLVSEEENTINVDYSYSNGKNQTINSVYITITRYQNTEKAQYFASSEMFDLKTDMETPKGNHAFISKIDRERLAFLPPPPSGAYHQKIWFQVENYVISFSESFDGPRMVTRDIMKQLIKENDDLEYWLNNNMGYVYNIQEEKVYR